MILQFKNKKLIFRKKEGRFTLDFWKGLGFALSFHIALLLLFKVRFSSHPNESPVRPFTEAIADATLPKKEWVAFESPVYPFDDDVPTFPALPSFSTEMRREEEPDFSILEKIPYKTGIFDD